MFIIRKSLRKNNGFSLIELMAGTAVLAVAMVAVVSMIVRISQEQQHEAFLTTLMTNRATFQSTISSDLSWIATQMNNVPPSKSGGTMGCLMAKNCLAQSGIAQNFALYDQNGNLFYDGTNPAAGFTKDGTPCTTYGSSATCILHINLTWTPICNTASNVDPNCSGPYVSIRGSYTQINSMSNVNWDNYNFTYGRAVTRNVASVPCPAAPPNCAAPLTAVCMGPLSWQCKYFFP